VKPLWLLVVACLLTTVSQAQSIRPILDSSSAGDDALVRVRELYGAALYEEALATLPAMPETGQEDDVDRYRMLCLLALGRTAEAERTVEKALARNPAFSVFPSEVSPRVVQFLNDVRKRVLPARVEALYARARTDYDERRYVEAVNHFTTVLELLSDPEVGAIGKLADLRIVAEEFRKLAYERLPQNVQASLSTTSPDLDVPDLDRIYTRLSPNVEPPIEVSRVLPPWHPPKEEAWKRVRGVIELTIDKRGRVEDVQVLERLAPFYDGALVAAARKWTFKPATLFGHPVRYRHLIEIRMGPTS